MGAVNIVPHLLPYIRLALNRRHFWSSMDRRNQKQFQCTYGQEGIVFKTDLKKLERFRLKFWASVCLRDSDDGFLGNLKKNLLLFMFVSEN